MQPLISGMVFLASAKADISEDLLLTSQGGVARLTPFARSSSSKACAAGLCVLERESRIRCFAFRDAIHRAILRPKPPRPPAMR